MPHKQELSFLFDVLAKMQINAGVMKLKEIDGQQIQNRLRAVWTPPELFLSLLTEMEDRTLYCLRDSFLCNYQFFLLPHTEAPSAFYIGPYLEEAPEEGQVLSLGEKNGIPVQMHSALREYYMGIPVIEKQSLLFTMLHTYCQRIWGRSDFAVRNIANAGHMPESPFTRSMLEMGTDDMLLNIKTIERRYEFENELIRSVAHGQMHLEKHFQRAFSDAFFEKRHPDPLRNAKNYCVIMNTLLRKAAENGGVHPVYLDRVSSDFASRIENLKSLSQNAPLMLDMFRTYCRLVRTHSLKRFSKTVQKTMLLIESNLSNDLSPRVLAESLGISAGYLSAVFRRESGQTLTSYIHEKRMEYAEYLLSRSDLQIQNVALHCGIMDVQYFTKLFKKHFHVPPSEYRRMLREGNEE